MKCDELAGAIEGVLFGRGEAVSIKELTACFELPETEILLALDVLKQSYLSTARGIRLVQVKETYQLSTKPDFYSQICKITRQREKTGLPRAAMETLAIIAYRQPVTRLIVDELRGVNSSNAIARLLDCGLICDGGRMEAPGRPILYKTTSTFLKAMGFTDLKEMPEFEVFSQGRQESFELQGSENKQKVADEMETLTEVLEKTLGDAPVIEVQT